MKIISFILFILVIFQNNIAAQACQVVFYVQDAESKKAISGVTIRMDEMGFTEQNTADDGKAVFQKMSKRKIYFSVIKPGYISLENESVNVLCDNRADNFKISLHKSPPDATTTIFGKVRNQSGENQPGVEVFINIAGVKKTATTDETGNYVIEIPEKELKEKSFSIEAIWDPCPFTAISDELPADGVKQIDLDLCAESRGVSVIREEISDNFRELSGLIGAIEMAVPADILIKLPGETEREFQSRAKSFRLSERDLTRQAFDKFKISTETFNAHRSGINNQQLSQDLRNVYEKQKDAVDAAFGYVEQLNHLLSLDKPDAAYLREALCKQQEKILEAKIQLADAAGLYAWTLKKTEDIEILKLYLQLARLKFQATDPTEFYPESRKMIAGFYNQKAETIGKCAGIKHTPPAPDSIPSNHDIEKQLDSIFSPQLPASYQVKIDSTLRDPEKLLTAGTMAYLSNDSRATRYYYQIGLQNDTVPKHFKRYFELSMERLDNAEIYDGGLGMMVLKITPKNAFDKAGIKQFDVITRINGRIIKEPKDISDELIERNKENSLIEFWRDGKKKSAILKAGLQGGAIIVPLITCLPLQI